MKGCSAVQRCFIILLTCKVPELELVVGAAADHPGAAGVEGEACDGLVAVGQAHLVTVRDPVHRGLLPLTLLLLIILVIITLKS